MKNYTNLKDSYRSQNSLFSSVYESLYNEKPDTNQNSILYPKVEEYFTIDPMFKQFNITEIFKKSPKKLLSHYIYAHLTIFSYYKKNYFNHKSDTEDTFMITNTLLNCLKNDNEGNISNLLSIYLTELNYDPFILNFAPNRIQKWKKKFTKKKKELEEKWTECLGGGSNLLSLLCYSPNIISRKHLIEILMKYHRVYSSNYKHEWTKLSIFESMKTDLINYIFIYQSLLRHYTYYLFEVAFQNNQDKIVKLVNLDSANILDQAIIKTNVFDDLLEIKNEIFTLSTDQLKNNLNSMPNFSSPPLTIINYCKETHYNESDNILFPIEITTNYSEYLHDYFKFIKVNSSN